MKWNAEKRWTVNHQSSIINHHANANANHKLSIHPPIHLSKRMHIYTNTYLQSADPVKRNIPSSDAAIHVTTDSCSLSCTENTSLSWSANTLLYRLPALFSAAEIPKFDTMVLILSPEPIMPDPAELPEEPPINALGEDDSTCIVSL